MPGGSARAAGRRWERAKAAAAALDTAKRAMLFRYLFAQLHNRHDPRRGQEHTKREARRRAAELCSMMGLEMSSPPPMSLRHDEAWRTAAKAVNRLSDKRQRSFMLWIARSCAPPCDDKATQLEREHEIIVFSHYLVHMDRQIKANESGWDATTDKPKRTARRRSRR